MNQQCRQCAAILLFSGSLLALAAAARAQGSARAPAWREPEAIAREAKAAEQAAVA